MVMRYAEARYINIKRQGTDKGEASRIDLNAQDLQLPSLRPFCGGCLLTCGVFNDAKASHGRIRDPA